MENLQNANWGQWGRGFRGRQVAPSLAPALGVGPGWDLAWLLGALPGSVPVDFGGPQAGTPQGQEDSRPRTTSPFGCGYLCPLVLGPRWGILSMFFLPNSTFCTQLPFQSHMHAHNSLSTISNNSLKHISATSNTYLSLLTHCWFENTHKYKLTPANPTIPVRWLAHI